MYARILNVEDDLEILKTPCAKLFQYRSSIRNLYMTGTSVPNVTETTFSAADEAFMKRFSGLTPSQYKREKCARRG